jgi:hypothetical protein
VADKDSREELLRTVKIDAAGIVYGPGGINLPKELLWHNTLESIWTQLEGFADEFERRAATPEQKALADTFAAFVSDFTRERLSMAALGDLATEVEAFDMDQIDVALAGELIELGASAGRAWQAWMDDPPVYAVEPVPSQLHQQQQQRSLSKDALAIASRELAAALFGDGATMPKDNPEIQKDGHQHEPGRRR